MPETAVHLGDEVKSIRFGDELTAKIDLARGNVGFSEWVRERIRETLDTPEERAVQDVLATMRARGVTVEMLATATEKKR